MNIDDLVKTFYFSQSRKGHKVKVFNSILLTLRCLRLCVRICLCWIFYEMANIDILGVYL